MAGQAEERQQLWQAVMRSDEKIRFPQALAQSQRISLDAELHHLPQDNLLDAG
jgi:hypothetical protein